MLCIIVAGIRGQISSVDSGIKNIQVNVDDVIMDTYTVVVTDPPAASPTASPATKSPTAAPTKYQCGSNGTMYNFRDYKKVLDFNAPYGEWVVGGPGVLVSGELMSGLTGWVDWLG